jgi:hypothetical protein
MFDRLRFLLEFEFRAPGRELLDPHHDTSRMVMQLFVQHHGICHTH